MRKIAWHLSRTTLWCLFALLLLLAVLTLAGRLLIHKVDDYRVELARELSDELGGLVQIDTLKGSWEGNHPLLLIEGVSIDAKPVPVLLGPGHRPPVQLPALALDQMRLRLDFWQSLKNLQPVVRELEIEGVRIRLEQWESGQLSLAGFDPAPRTEAGMELPPAEPIWQQLLEPLLLQRQVSLQGLEIKVMTRSGASRWLSIPSLEYVGGRWNQALKGRLQLDDNPSIELSLTRRGDPGSLDPGLLQGYLDWPRQSLALWLELIPGGELLERLELGGQIWLGHRGEQWRVQGQLQLPGIELRLPGEVPAPRMANLGTEFTLLFEQSSDWQLWLEKLQGRIEGVELEPSPVYLRGRDEGVQLATDTLELEPLKQIALAYPGLPVLAQSLVDSLNPVGQLQQVSVFVDPVAPERVEVSARLEQVAVDAWDEAPSASGVSGTLRMRGGQGEFMLDSPALSLGLTELFNAPWQWGHSSGRLFWFIEDQRFSLLGRDLLVQAPLGAVQGELRLDFPFDERPDEMGLLLSVVDGDPLLAGRYVPAKILPEELTRWLDEALDGGRVSDGLFLYNGAISKTDYDSAYSYDMYFRAKQVALDYAPTWPALREADALVKVTNDRVAVQVDGARLLDDAVLEGAQVSFDGDPDQPLLNVQGQLSASGADGLRVLNESPLGELLDGVAAGWKIGGQLQVGLDLGIGLAAEVEDQIKVQVGAQNVDLYLDQAELELKGLQGTVFYDLETGLSSNNFQGQLLGQHARFSLSGREGGRYTRIEARSQVGARTLQNWLELDWLAMAKGQSAYQAILEIAPERAPSLEIRSDLRGMALDLPAYFGKSGRSARASRVQLALADPLQLDFSLGKGLHGLLQLSAEGTLNRGRIRLGSRGRMALPRSGLHIDGRLAEVSVPAVQRWYKSASWLQATDGEAGGGGGLPSLFIDRLRFAELKIDDNFTLKPLQLSLSPQDRGYRIQAESPELAGQLWYPGDNRRWRLNLSRLYLPEPAASESSSGSSNVDPLADFNPATLPPVSIAIDQIRLGSRELGSLKAEVSPHAKGAHLFNLALSMPDLDVSGDISWNYENRLHGTTTKLSLKSNNIAGLIQRFGYDSGAEARSSKLDMDLYWPGSPLAVSGQALRGNMQMKMKRGRFVALDRKANVLKIFGVLNFGSITRRLQLDFSDLFQEGIAFDEVVAKLRFNQGRVTTIEPMLIDGPSSSFRLNGWYDLGSNRTDMRLAVTLPVTQNLPVIAVLMGLPQVGGAIFLADKLLGDSVQRFASVRYRIRGDLDNPEVEFDRAFTNKTD